LNRGIVTDRDDITRRAVAKGRDPEQTTVGQIASKELVAVRADQADLAFAGNKKQIGELVEEIPQPPSGPRA
jgi:signal-transduction protein with cAMP-binding, CBS, and nucleotidyltransferase domain